MKELEIQVKISMNKDSRGVKASTQAMSECVLWTIHLRYIYKGSMWTPNKGPVSLESSVYCQQHLITGT